MKDNMMIQNFICNQMVLIPEGTETVRHFTDPKKWISSNYRMSIPSNGHNQEERCENIYIDAFYMMKYTVTNELYNLITGSAECKEKITMPKINISWIEAIKFCNRISDYYNLTPYYSIDSDSDVKILQHADGFRLPESAQWQYACRGGINKYQYGEMADIAWYLENSSNHIHEVGQKIPNAFGLYDMLGNVWEWCFDLYNQDTYADYRVFRGGSYAEKERVCGATTRRKSMTTFKIDDLGFRLVLPFKKYYE